MTIALALKVNDGVILAADSAATLTAINPETGQQGVVTVYNNANKIANLLKGSPIGMITWGAGSIGPESTATLAKDLREMFSGKATEHVDWRLDPSTYAMKDVAARFREFMFDQRWQPFLNGLPEAAPKPPDLGCLVTGYSANGTTAELYAMEMHEAECGGPDELFAGQETGIAWLEIHRCICYVGSAR